MNRTGVVLLKSFVALSVLTWLVGCGGGGGGSGLQTTLRGNIRSAPAGSAPSATPTTMAKLRPDRLWSVLCELWEAKSFAQVPGIGISVRDALQVAKPDVRDQTIAAAVRSESLPGDFVITDNLFAVALAGRDVPGPVVDTSHQRIDAGLLTVNDLDAAANRYRVNLILVDGSRLTSIPGFSAWLAAHYRALREVEPGAILYFRTAS